MRLPGGIFTETEPANVVKLNAGVGVPVPLITEILNTPFKGCGPDITSCTLVDCPEQITVFDAPVMVATTGCVTSTFCDTDWMHPGSPGPNAFGVPPSTV